MKVDGFSQAMEFEEHRGTVIYSTVNDMVWPVMLEKFAICGFDASPLGSPCF